MATASRLIPPDVLRCADPLPPATVASAAEVELIRTRNALTACAHVVSHILGEMIAAGHGDALIDFGTLEDDDAWIEPAFQALRAAHAVLGPAALAPDVSELFVDRLTHEELPQ